MFYCKIYEHNDQQNNIGTSSRVEFVSATHHGCLFGCFSTQWKDTGEFKWELMPSFLDPNLEKTKNIQKMVIHLSFWGKI